MSKIIPSLWYTDKAEEAAAFYASVLPRSEVESVTPLAADTPSGAAGSVKVVEFTLMGQPFIAIGAGPLDPFRPFHIVPDPMRRSGRDRPAVGGAVGRRQDRAVRLGAQDRYGLFWQIAPAALGEMMKDQDRARAKRVAEAMLKMTKLDIEGLKKAYEGPA